MNKVFTASGDNLIHVWHQVISWPSRLFTKYTKCYLKFNIRNVLSNTTAVFSSHPCVKRGTIRAAQNKHFKWRKPIYCIHFNTLYAYIWFPVVVESASVCSVLSTFLFGWWSELYIRTYFITQTHYQWDNESYKTIVIKNNHPGHRNDDSMWDNYQCNGIADSLNFESIRKLLTGCWSLWI